MASPLLAAGERELVTREDAPQNATLAFFERLARDPAASVEKIERLMAMWERSEARKAEAAFNAAMSAAQTAMRPVATDSANSQTRSRYASYEALDRVIRPIYTSNGFGLSFDTGDGAPADTIRVLCYVTHRDGHARTYHVDMPADGKGAKGGDVMTKTHAAGAAMSYGMRYLLKMIFNVAVGEDDDDGNSATQKEGPEAPAGYDAWFAALEGVAANGMPAFSEAWNKSSEAFRRYLSSTAPKVLASLKTKAGKVKP
jgi:hypothetical protein